MKAQLLVGVSASGKTTWANEQRGFSVVSRDDLRRRILEQDGKLLPHENLWSKWKFKRENEVTELYWDTVERMAYVKRDIILSDTNLNLARRQEMQKRLEDFGYEVSTRQFNVSYEDACKRDRFRKDVCGPQVIWKQYKQLYGEVYVPPKDAPKVILVDIDGTLAKMVDRGPFDWSKVGQDKFDSVVACAVRSLAVEKHCDIIVLSGRDSVCRNETVGWLNEHRFYYDELYMRSEGDMRKDSIVKRELFDKHIRDKYNVVAVFDDRPQVCRMWQLLGLKVFQVGDPYEEF